MALYRQNPDGSLTVTYANGNVVTVGVNDPNWKAVAQAAVGAGGNIKGPIDRTPWNNTASKTKQTSQTTGNNTASKTKQSTSRGATPALTPRLRGLDLADMYGLTYNAQDLEKKFNKATQKQFDVLRKEYAQTENQFYDNLFGTKQTVLDSIRRSNASAVATGASRGLQAANELSAILGLTQEGVAGATSLAQDRNLLMDKEQAAYAENALNALNTSNQLRQAIAGIDANLYAADTQFSIGEMDYFARLDAAAKGLLGAQAQAEAQKYMADMNAKASMYASDLNLTGNKYASQMNLAGNIYSADKNYAGNIYSANQNLASQKALAEATKEAARINASAYQAPQQQQQYTLLEMLDQAKDNEVLWKAVYRAYVGGNMSAKEIDKEWKKYSGKG